MEKKHKQSIINLPLFNGLYFTLHLLPEYIRFHFQFLYFGSLPSIVLLVDLEVRLAHISSFFISLLLSFPFFYLFGRLFI